MLTRFIRRLPAFGSLLALAVTAALPGGASSATQPQPGAISYWGMNLYLTKRERLQTHDNLTLLGQAARDAGVQWTREELPWDLIEPAPGTFTPVYDDGLKQAAGQGFGIIGILLTTPDWARDPACASSYWCPPRDPNDYARFAGYMAERYDGDGQNDAPGSPRIAAWEIWNEPNDTALWPDIGGGADARKRRYGDVLVAAYGAIKAADPTALVLTGGTYIFDGGCAGGICDGINFMGGVFQQRPAARQAFDVFAIHPFIPTERPDAPNIPRLITVEGRIRNTRSWLDAPQNGRGDAPIWITEIGWCTAVGACPGGIQVSEAQQADYLIRSMVIAQQNSVQHTSWFQFEDAFDDPNRLWSNAAIVRNYNSQMASYPPKPAYIAYRTLARLLAPMAPAGAGPLHTHAYDPSKPYDPSGNATYDYRYICGSETVDVLWRPADTIQATLPVAPGKQVTLIHGDGTQQALSPASGGVALTIAQSPILIRQADPPRITVAPTAVTLLAELGAATAAGSLQIDSNSCQPLAWTASATGAALTLSTTSGVTPAALPISADVQGLPLGAHILGSVTVTGANGAGVATRQVRAVIVETLYRSYLPAIRR
jgi:hypothetical protein